MCAIQAGRRGRRALVLDHAERIGKKILISGGGRCNFTNLHARPENFHSANPHFAKSALARYTPADIIALVEKHKIPYHEKTLGQLFCDRAAQDIVTMLQQECAAAHVEIRTASRILSVSHDTSFLIETAAGPIRAAAVVVATGGLSIPRMGATSFGYDLAQRFGLNIVPCRPALVPFVFSPEDCNRWCDLTGLSTEVIATTDKLASTISSRTPRPAFREKMLFTHRGLSGPAILQISSYWRPGEPITLDLVPNSITHESDTNRVPHSSRSDGWGSQDARVETTRHPGEEIFNTLLASKARRDATAAFEALRTTLPARLAERWLTINALEHRTPTEPLSNQAIAELETKLHNWTITPVGTEGYAKAEVTAGGVDTVELDARTMQSKKIPGLYFIGEVVDVTGWLGGYNFQWAWASGAAVGQSI
jgi:predicted flavoprotein YhiN